MTNFGVSVSHNADGHVHVRLMASKPHMSLEGQRKRRGIKVYSKLSVKARPHT